MSHLFLWDIDLTLIRTHGVGRFAMNQVMAELTGVADVFGAVDFGGRTDRAIIRDALRAHGREPVEHEFEAFIAAFEARYIPALEAGLRERGGTVLPGVRAVLDALAARPDVRLGLATGNFERAAWVKLRHFGLDHYFAGGGFADDAEDRGELVATAIRRLGGAGGGDWAVIVLGDTAHDIGAAAANQAVAVGVATGASSPALLAAAGAAHVFADLSDSAQVVHTLLGADPPPPAIR